MDIVAQDCRLWGSSDAQADYWTNALHLPTGVQIETPIMGSVGLPGKRRLMQTLQQAVNEHMERELQRL